jgi:predicted ester cyclase
MAGTMKIDPEGGEAGAASIAERLVRDFLGQVWGPRHDVEAIDRLMTDDYVLHSGGQAIHGRDAFKAWIAEFQRTMPDAVDEVLDVFANASGDRVCARWINRGINDGVFGLKPDGRPVEFHGISVYRVRDGRLSECWVEREAPRRPAA